MICWLIFIQKILYSLTPSFRTALCNKEFRTAFEAFLFFQDPVNRIQLGTEPKK